MHHDTDTFPSPHELRHQMRDEMRRRKRMRRGMRGNPFEQGGRMRRGEIRTALLGELVEAPGHGYELMQRLEEKSGGAWRPSPGSVYPTLQMLEDEGLVRSEATGGKNVFHLTETGREAAEAGEAAPWDAVAGDAAAVDVRRTIGQLGMAFRQVVQVGTAEQVQRASAILNDARKAIYGILAEDVEES